MNLYHITVKLAANEWGNELMRKIAQETFEQFKDKSPLIVEIREHAGWFLVFALSNENEIVTIGSANDAANFYGESKNLREKYFSMKHNYLPSIQR